MAHFANDVHHRLSTRIRDIIPDFVESEYPAFVSFVKAYYEFLEQYDDKPVASTYTLQPGVVTVRSGNSTIIGANTQFSNTEIYANNVQFRIGSDQFRIRSVANTDHLIVYEVPVRSYFANTHTVETNKSIRQASGALRQMLTIHDVDHTLDDFVTYFRDTYLLDIPQGLTDTTVLIPRILDFYQSRGSEASYQFLFRSLYGKDVSFSFPRESVFTTSDNEWVEPTILRLDYDTNASVNGNVSLIETREIVGLSSNAHATVLQAVQAFEGNRRVVRLFISDPVITQELGGLLLEDGSGVLVATKYGAPPEGLANRVYDYNLIQEFVTATTFQAGETISTVPTNDPDAISGQLLGSITGFIINQRGAGYQIGDLVYPPARYANGAVATGGFGAVGRISAFTDVDLNQLNIDDVGLGYYSGLPLIVDNTGTGGGFGLSGYVSAVSPGNIILHEDTDAEVADGDILTFTFETDGLEYQASREKINYYEVGVSLADLFGGLLLEGDGNTGSDIQTEDGRQLLSEAAITLDQASWSTNTGSAVYGTNLQTTIIGLTSNLSTYPVFVNGVRTELGEVFSVTIESFGQGYVAGLPTIAVQTPVIPTADAEGLDPLSYEEIFGEGFHPALLTVQKEVGQIGQVEVVTGGSGYSNVAFTVNSSSSTTTNGHDAELSMTLGALSYGEPYFRNTRSFASGDQYLQDVTKYQPFSYVMTVEEDLSRYATVLKKLVHPAGGLLLPRQTITTEVDLASIITFGGIDLTFTIESDSEDPPNRKTISISAPEVSIALSLNVGDTPPEPAIFNVQTTAVTTEIGLSVNSTVISVSNEEETQSELVILPVDAAILTLSNEEEGTYLVVPVDAATIAISGSSVTEHLTVPLTEAVITISNEEESEHLTVPVSLTSVQLTAPTSTTDVRINLSVAAGVITVSNEEETQTELTNITVSNVVVAVMAPAVVIATSVSLGVTYDTIVAPYEAQQPGDYETEPLLTVVNWEADRIDFSAPNATV